MQVGSLIEMNPAIGQQLRQAREQRKLTLEQVAQATRIRVHYLVAIEAGEFSSLPSNAQARGFLRAYAGFLNLDADALLQISRPVEALPASEPVPPLKVDAQGSGGNGGESVGMPETPKETAESIFVDIGGKLQHQRELLGLSLEDVERHTHLRQHYLRALESGNLEGLPSPVQGRGMLNNYASFLGLDPEPLLLRFADGLQARLISRQQEMAPSAPSPDQPGKPSAVRRLLSNDMVTVGVIILVLLAFVAWGGVRILAMRAVLPAMATAPSIADVLLATATPSSTPTLDLGSGNLQSGLNQAFEATAMYEGLQATLAKGNPSDPAGGVATVSADAAAATPEGEYIAPAIEGGLIQIHITIHQRAWLRVMVDGKVEYEGRVLPGNALAFGGSEKIELITGNGAAIQVYFNKQDLGTMGIYGQVIHRVFTRDGVQTPTPTISPTPTKTRRPTVTPRATSTPKNTSSPPELP